jgi:hypothetical protein
MILPSAGVLTTATTAIVEIKIAQNLYFVGIGMEKDGNRRNCLVISRKHFRL